MRGRRSSRPICPPSCSISPHGVRRRRRSAFSIPRRRARWRKHARCSTELGALDDGRITPEGHALRRLPLPPRLARMVVDAAREGAGALAADIAAVLTERGLGGDDVDLTHRVESFRRDRSRRAGDARAMAKRWAEMAPPMPVEAGVRGWRMEERRRDPLARLSGSHREEPRQRVVHARKRPRRQCRRRLAAGARAVHRGRRTDRQRRAGPHRAGGADRACRNRSALRGSHREPRRGDV